MMRRAVTAIALWCAVVGGLAGLGWVALPMVWEGLFPSEERRAAPPPLGTNAEVARRALDQAVVGAGGALPSDGLAPLGLPRGLGPEGLRDALRTDPRLGGATVYVTQADDIFWRLRVFAGPELLLQRDLRPWMTASPPHPPGNPPELVVLFDARGGDDETIERVLAWRSPVALVLPPFAPSTLRHADAAARASREVIAVIDPALDLAEQIRAVPHASAVLLEAPSPRAILAPLREEDLVAVDSCPGGCIPAGEETGGPVLRLAARLTGAPEAILVARNLAVRRGYGVVIAAANPEGASAAEALLDGARADGLSVVYVSEAGRQHGLSAGR